MSVNNIGSDNIGHCIGEGTEGAKLTGGAIAPSTKLLGQPLVHPAPQFFP